MPKLPKMPNMSQMFGGRNAGKQFSLSSLGHKLDPNAEQKAREEDIKARMRDTALLHQMDIDEANARFPFERAGLGQSMAERGLGHSGIRTGAEGRQLSDFTTAVGRAQVEHQMEQDALRRQLEIERMRKTVVNGGGGGGFPFGVFGK